MHPLPYERFDLPGAFEYNGVSFGTAHKTERFACTPVYDAAGRTVVYNLLALTVRFEAAGDPTRSFGASAGYPEYLRRALTKPGGHFLWDRRGMGVIEVNRPGPGGVRDVLYGPRPQVVEIKVLGASDPAWNAWQVTWSAEIAVPECRDARYRLAPMEYGFQVGYRIDNGLTTRTTTGYVRVPATRRAVDDRALPDAADRYREDVVPGRLPGFKRVQNGEFRLDYAKTRLDFTVVDQQLPGPPPPPGVLDWDVSESLATSTLAMKQWTGSVDATYTVAPGFDPEQGQRHFLSLAADRVRALKAAKRASDGKVFTTGLRIGAAHLASASQLPQFTATLLFRVNAATLTDFLAGHGLWRPLPDTGGWEAWDRSLAGVFSPRGLSGIRFSPDEDQIVDLCAAPVRSGPPAAAPASPTRPPLLRGGVFAPPLPRESWLRYEAWLEVQADSGTTALRTIPTGPPPPDPAPAYGAGTAAQVAALFASRASPGTLPGTFAGQLSNDTTPRGGTLQNEPQVTVKPRAAPVIVVYLNVRALRVAFPVPCPALFDKAGNRLLPDLRLGEKAWECRQVGCLGDGQTLYGAWGRLRYTLPSDVAAGLTTDDLVLFNPLHADARTG